MHPAVNAIRRCFFAATVTLASVGTAVAASYPDKPVRLLVGFPPGGPTDIIARIIGQGLSHQLGQPFIIENRGGAGGTIAARSVAAANPDGYTLLVAVESSNTRGVALNKTMPYDTEKDFSYIAKVAKQRNLVVVNPDLPVSSITDLIQYAKAHPGKLNVGGTFGATSHIGGILFDQDNHTQMTFIAYPGGSQPISDLMAGILQVGFFTEATISQQVKANKLKPLAVAAPERSPSFPDLPTVAEAGGHPMELSPWFGLAGPAGLPAPVVSRLEQAVKNLVSDDSFIKQLEAIGALPIVGSTSKAFQTDITKETAYWKQFVIDANIPINQ